MNNTTASDSAASTPLTSPSPAFAETARAGEINLISHRWVGRLLVSTGVLTLLADWLLFDLHPGAGWSLFFATLWGAVLMNRDLSKFSLCRRDVLLGLMMVLTLAQFTWRASFSSGLCLVLLTVYLAGHLLFVNQHPWWRRFIEQMMAFMVAPLRWAQCLYWVSMGGWKREDSAKAEAEGKLSGFSQAGRLVGIVAPSAVLAVFFLILLGKGNAILGDALGDFTSEFFNWANRLQMPGTGRLVFMAFVATALVGLLWRSRVSRSLGWLDKLCASRSAVAAGGDFFVGIWRMRVLLIMMNLIFFAANTIDVSYLWSGVELPGGMTISKFVHTGTYSLIASVILAAIVISVLFQQKREITGARGQGMLAMVWIAQNLLLLNNVGLRVKMYVDEYQLSILRVHLGLFLLLVAAGFVLLAIRVITRRNFAWLAGANLLVVFFLFFTVQFWDTRAFVAEYNAVQADGEGKLPDTAYLMQLGPSAWPTLLAIANGEYPNIDESARYDLGLDLVRLRSDEEYESRSARWQEFQIHQYRMRKLIGVSEIN